MDVMDEKAPTEVAPRFYKPVWSHIIAISFLHLAGLYGVYLLIYAKFYTLLWTLLTYELSILGITAGSHRLWSHRTYKAKLPLKLILVFCQTLAQQGSVIGWAHNHRIHHKFSDTDADPHNARRGIFFSHVGWLLVEYHPQVLEKRKKVDMSDLYNDSLLVFQKKYFLIVMPLICFVLPSVIPMYYWGESVQVAVFVNVLRYIVVVHSAFMINSYAHAFGSKPYDRNILPGDSLFASMVTQGEGWHNFHHAFPWDYKAGELGSYGSSWTTMVIDLMAKIGWAYDLKAASPALIKQKVENKGDGTHEMFAVFKQMG